MANTKVTEYLTKKLPEIQFEFKPKENEAVILTYDTEINYSKMQNVSFLLNNTSVEYIVTHSDIFCPTASGPVPDAGSFIKLFELTTGRTPDIVLGKPAVTIAKEILNNFSVNELAVTGDRLYTDKKLADNLKCDFICVLSGETTRMDVQNYTGNYPSIVVNNLGNIK